MRTIAVGDVHGCSLALAVLLEWLGPRADDRFVFLGDYIDRGPGSRDVIDQVLDLSTRCDVVPLLGNHELLMIASLAAGEANAFWLQQCGGQETLISYGGSLDQIPRTHQEFLRGCRRHFETASHLFLHANYDADKPLDEQPESLLFWQHLTGFIPIPHCSGKTVITGHTPQRTGEVLDLGHLLCIDTACFAGGWLTALDVDTKQTWQVNRYGERRA